MTFPISSSNGSRSEANDYEEMQRMHGWMHESLSLTHVCTGRFSGKLFIPLWSEFMSVICAVPLEGRNQLGPEVIDVGRREQSHASFSEGFEYLEGN